MVAMTMQFMILFGFVAGLIANFLNPRIARSSLFGAILLGITGSLVGGIIANLIGTTLQLHSQNTLTASLVVVGCMALLAAQRIVRDY